MELEQGICHSQLREQQQRQQQRPSHPDPPTHCLHSVHQPHRHVILARTFILTLSLLLISSIYILTSLVLARHRHPCDDINNEPARTTCYRNKLVHDIFAPSISSSDPVLWFNSSSWESETVEPMLAPGDGKVALSREERILSRGKRDVPCKRGKRLNRYVDNLFDFAGRAILPDRLPMPLENVTIDLPEYNVLVFLYAGVLTQVEGLRRKGKAWVQCVNQTEGLMVSVGLPTKVEEVRIFYKYRLIKDWHLVYDGDVMLQVVHPKAQVQITDFRANMGIEFDQQRVDAVRIWSVGMVRVMLRGLGNLTSALSMVLTSWLNNNFDHIFPMVKDRVEDMLRIRLNRSFEPRDGRIPFEAISD